MITADNDCTACGPGKYNPYANGDTCFDCPSNHWNNVEGSDDCTLCAPGKFNDRTGATYCMFRAAVEIGPPRPVETAEACLPGKFREEFDQGSSCFNCPPGTYSDTLDATECTACSGNTYQPWSGKNDASDCMDCPAGKWTQDQMGHTSCVDATTSITCGAGQQPNTAMVQDQNGHTLDEDEDGLYGVEEAQCVACNYGWYAGASDTTCKRCGVGQGPVDAEGAMQELPGDYNDGNNPLFNNTLVRPVQGAVGCADCPPGWYWSNGDCLQCTPGHFNNIAGALACQVCDANHYAHEYGATACTEAATQDELCSGGRYLSTSASPCTATCDNPDPSATCDDDGVGVTRCKCGESQPLWDDVRQECLALSECDAAPECPEESCAPASAGCEMVPHNAIDADGCLKYPCGIEKCTGSCLTEDNRVVNHGWTGPGIMQNWCNTCTCSHGQLTCTEGVCGDAPICSHLSCAFHEDHVKVIYDKQESVGVKHRCGHLDENDPTQCMCTCFA
jgi:hypothetical protein